MTILITYDLEWKHTEFKLAMKELGYYDSFTDGSNKIVPLPNTTLIHFNKDCSSAVADAKSVDRQLGSRLQKCIAVPIQDNWDAIR